MDWIRSCPPCNNLVPNFHSMVEFCLGVGGHLSTLLRFQIRYGAYMAKIATLNGGKLQLRLVLTTYLHNLSTIRFLVHFLFENTHRNFRIFFFKQRFPYLEESRAYKVSLFEKDIFNIIR